ncbi:MAG TPA: hypothetical protein VG454_09830, partial [Gemmatimonadales bacterium]|nr:hypothetical protein [Gemmatimonadales bacterium]
LSAVGFVVAPRDERMAVQVPGWRPDVTREVDLIEEVARLKGYDTFPDELRAYRPTTVPEAPAEITLRHIREHLVRSGIGLLEARTLPLGPADNPEAVPVQNPLSADEAYLRSRVLPGLLRRVEHNWSVGQRDVRLFEVGTVFKKPSTGARPEEELHLGIVVTGARHPAHWSDGTQVGERAKLPDMDIWDLKRHFELAVGVAAPFCTIQPASDGAGWVAARRDAVGEVWGAALPLEADAPKWAAPLYGLEIRIAVPDGVEQAALPRYQPLPTQPPVVRDLSLVLPAGITAARVEAVLRREGGALLERLDVLDEYRGKVEAGSGLPEGTRGVTWRCTFRDPEGTRTLTDREVDALLSRMLKALEDDLNVRRRSA